MEATAANSPNLHDLSPSEESMVLPTTADHSEPRRPSLELLHPARLLEENSRNTSDQEKLTKSRRWSVTKLGWWWEIASVFFGTTCVVLIITILLVMDNKPLDHWSLPIQPNSLVAVLSALSRSALLYPVAEGLGQLKWSHFERPRPLSQFHDFDAASRGPVGSCRFLWRSRAQALLASLGALNVVLLLALSPFAQQSIYFSTRLARIPHTSGSTTQTFSFISHPGPAGESAQWLVYSIAQIISSAFSDQSWIQPSHSYCPTTECSVPEFQSLAVCASCTEKAVNNEFFDNCTYSMRDAKNSSVSYETPVAMRNAAKGQTGWDFEGRCFKRLNVDDTLTVSIVRDGIDLQYKHEEAFEEAEASLGTIWEWRVNAATPFFVYPRTCGIKVDGHTMDGVENLASHTCFSAPGFFQAMQATDTIGDINGTLTQCRLNLCSQHYQGMRIVQGQTIGTNTTDIPLRVANSTEMLNLTHENDDRNNNNLIPISSNENNAVYQIGKTEGVALQQVYAQTFMSNISWANRYTGTTEEHGSFSDRFQKIARSLTIMLQGPSNHDAMNVTADAYGDIIFVQVRWPWMIMPICITVMTVIFQSMVIAQSSRRKYIFKTSILAVLFHGLSGWDLRNQHAEHERALYDDLYKQSTGIVASFGEDDEENLKLKME